MTVTTVTAEGPSPQEMVVRIRRLEHDLEHLQQRLEEMGQRLRIERALHRLTRLRAELVQVEARK